MNILDRFRQQRHRLLGSSMCVRFLFPIAAFLLFGDVAAQGVSSPLGIRTSITQEAHAAYSAPLVATNTEKRTSIVPAAVCTGLAESGFLSDSLVPELRAKQKRGAQLPKSLPREEPMHTESKESTTNLLGTEMMTCDGTNYCHFDERLTGRHEVCVAMTNVTLKELLITCRGIWEVYGKPKIGKIKEGRAPMRPVEFMCIDKFLWSIEMGQRSPTNIFRQGVEVICESTNMKIRDVYNFHSHGHDSFYPDEAVMWLDEICGSPDPDAHSGYKLTQTLQPYDSQAWNQLVPYLTEKNDTPFYQWLPVNALVCVISVAALAKFFRPHHLTRSTRPLLG